MADQILRVVFYIPTSKHCENNSDNRNETWKQERARKNVLAGIKSVIKSDISDKQKLAISLNNIFLIPTEKKQ